MASPESSLSGGKGTVLCIDDEHRCKRPPHSRRLRASAGKTADRKARRQCRERFLFHPTVTILGMPCTGLRRFNVFKISWTTTDLEIRLRNQTKLNHSATFFSVRLLTFHLRKRHSEGVFEIGKIGGHRAERRLTFQKIVEGPESGTFAGGLFHGPSFQYLPFSGAVSKISPFLNLFPFP